MTNIAVSSIELRNQSADVLATTTNQRLLEYTIPNVMDYLQGQEYECVALAGSTRHTETVKIQVQGKCPWDEHYLH